MTLLKAVSSVRSFIAEGAPFFTDCLYVDQLIFAVGLLLSIPSSSGVMLASISGLDGVGVKLTEADLTVPCSWLTLPGLGTAFL